MKQDKMNRDEAVFRIKNYSQLNRISLGQRVILGAEIIDNSSLTLKKLAMIKSVSHTWVPYHKPKNKIS